MLGRPRLAVPLVTRCFRSSRNNVHLRKASGFRRPRRWPDAGFDGGDARTSHVPEEPLLCPCPALRPRQDRCTRPIQCINMAPAQSTTKAPTTEFRGSITQLQHSLSTPRSMDLSMTTQDSLPAVGHSLPDGLDYPQGSNERFPSLRLHLFLLPQACVTQALFRQNVFFRSKTRVYVSAKE